MTPPKILDPLERSLVHQWATKGVPEGREPRDFLADDIFPTMAAELEHWRRLAETLQGKPELRYAKCVYCGEIIDLPTQETAS